MAEKSYLDNISKVENQIIVHLRDRLANTRNSNEMFRIFSQFNALFVRPKIRGAIQEYQNQLVDLTKNDIRKLQDAFKQRFHTLDASLLCKVRGLPSVASSIMWARQIERQLNLYMKRIEDVLGTGWEFYSEGEKLKAETSAFKKKLDTTPLFDNWISSIEPAKLQVHGHIFAITSNKSLGGRVELKVNFNYKAMDLFREVSSLLQMNFTIPHTVASIAKDAKRVYQYASCLTESLKIYNQTLDKITCNPTMRILVASLHRDCQTIIQKGMSLKWDYFTGFDLSMIKAGSGVDFTALLTMNREQKHLLYIREFASLSSQFQSKVDHAILITSQIDALMTSLAECPYSGPAFKSILGELQERIDHLNMESYSNIDVWTNLLDDKVEQVLLARLDEAVDCWTQSFNKSVSQQVATHLNPRVSLSLTPITLSITLRGQQMLIEPPLEQIQTHWYNSLGQVLG